MVDRQSTIVNRWPNAVDRWSTDLDTSEFYPKAISRYQVTAATFGIKVDAALEKNLTDVLERSWASFFEGYFMWAFDKKKNKVELREAITAKNKLVVEKCADKILPVIQTNVDKAIAMKY